MNSLEFIEKETKDIKNVLDEELDDENALFIHSLIAEDYVGWLNDKLQTLEQIKLELEAWEVVKKFGFDNNGVYLLRLDKDDEYDNEYYKKLKKALEVNKYD